MLRGYKRTAIGAHRRRLLAGPVAALALACVALAGCGGSGHATTRSTAADAQATSPRAGFAVPRRARASCEKAVNEAPLLAASAKPEIAALCWRINQVVEDNEKTVRSICQEVANASQLSSDSARARTMAACYAAGMRS